MEKWLLNRFFAAGDQAKPRFAFQGSVNWMRALAIECGSSGASDVHIAKFYESVQPRKSNREADNLVFESAFLAFQNLAALKCMHSDSLHKYDVCRAAILIWYYTVYFSASAMVAAASGGKFDTHAATASAWDFELVQSGLVMRPFNLSLSSLVASDCEKQIEILRAGNKFDLNRTPESQVESFGALISYLGGTADFERWKVEEVVRRLPEFKQLDVGNFRTKAAREIRDTHLRSGRVNFLDQAMRYRGKANFRDSIFLTYGDDRTYEVERLVSDLDSVATVFLRMSSHFCRRRTEIGAWDRFVDDIREHSQLGLGVDVLRVSN